MMKSDAKVLYVYHCETCGHHGEVHLADDSHEDEESTCDACSGPVLLEWDGGVTLVVKKS